LQEDAAWSRRLLLAVGITLLATLCAAAILLAGSRSQEVSGGSASEDVGDTTRERSPAGNPRITEENEALVEDARSYAEDMGVSLEEAIRRLELQGGASPSRLERELRQSERDTFAGLWIRHKPDYGITVATAGDPEAMMEKVKPYVEGTQWEGTVMIKRVEATEAELDAARAEAERMLDRLRIRYSSGDNLYKNRMEIYVKDREAVQRKLQASGVELPEHVVIIEEWIRPT